VIFSENNFGEKIVMVSLLACPLSGLSFDGFTTTKFFLPKSMLIWSPCLGSNKNSSQLFSKRLNGDDANF
jgi:hypothetical protein